MSIYIGEPVVVSDMQGPCSDGFHVPLKEELEGIQTIMSGLGLSSIDNYKTYLHMPFAGCRQYSDGSAADQNGNYAHYWTSSHKSDDVLAYQWFLNYVGSDSVAHTYTGYGNSIRPYKNTPVVPDSSWTALYSNKIYHNSTLGLISLSSNGTTWVTIADKNLGATTVYNYGDTFSEDNCGKYYQRGNNYAFPRSGSVTTSSTQVNASTYGPGNYYESSTFITSYNWESSDNKNLRGGTSQGTSNKPIEVQNLYIGKYVWCFEPGANTVAYYKFDGNLNDSSSSGLNMSRYGTAVYGTTAQGATYATFNGSNFSNYLNGYTYNNSAYTMSFWLNFPAFLVGGVGAIIDFGTSTWDNIYIRVADKNSTFKVNDNTVSTTVDAWHYYTLVVRSGTVYIYKDGVDTGIYYTISGTISTDARLRLGSEGAGSTNGFHAGRGNLSELILEKKARSSQEISDYYNASKRNYGL